jgi:hypothetical protein
LNRAITLESIISELAKDDVVSWTTGDVVVAEAVPAVL